MMQDRAIYKVSDVIQQIPEADKVAFLRDLVSSLVANGHRDDVLRVLSEVAGKNDSVTDEPTSSVSAHRSHMEALRMPRFSLGVFGRPPLIR
jgi:hypothetical protein